jgi:hypothetical protein
MFPSSLETLGKRTLPPPTGPSKYNTLTFFQAERVTEIGDDVFHHVFHAIELGRPDNDE